MNFFLSSSDSGSYWYGPPATEVAKEIHWVFDFILWTSAIFFVIIIALGTYFVVRYRRRPGVDAEKTSSHNTALELLWSVIPTILVVAMFWYGFDTYMDLKRVPPDTYTINVTAQKWNWAYEYPNGMQSSELYVPAGRNIELVLSSVDVIHSFSVPDFAAKMDCVPGRYNKLWFKAPKPTVGEDGVDRPHVVFCTEYCGTQHSQMLSKVHVLEEKDFQTWYRTESNFLDSDMPAAEKGQKIYQIQGCAACHDLNGVDNPKNGGPSFKNRWGTLRPMADGTEVVMDENYVREAILQPNAKIVKGYPENRMPNFQGKIKPKALGYLMHFIKVQTDKYKADEYAAPEAPKSQEGN
jgi:cytochrome c oxidase subunit II